MCPFPEVFLDCEIMHLRPKSGTLPSGKPAVRALPSQRRMLRQMCSHVCGQMGVISSVDTCTADLLEKTSLFRICYCLDGCTAALQHHIAMLDTCEKY